MCESKVTSLALALSMLYVGGACAPRDSAEGAAAGAEVQTGFVAVEGGQLYYEVAGSGEPVLLIHGNTGDRRHWDLQFEALATHHTVVRYDLRGFGRSSLPVDTVPYTDFGDAAALLDGLGIQRAHVAGWSLGSAIAIDFAMAYPERVLSLIVAGPWIMGYNSPGAQEMFRGMGQVATAMAEEGPQAAVQALMNAAFMVSTIRNPEAASRFSAIAEDYSFWAFVNPSPQRGLDPPALGRTGTIGVPTLIVSGQFDVPACREISTLLDETIPESRLVVMPGTGHMMLMEKPDAFNALVSDFLTEHAEAR